MRTRVVAAWVAAVGAAAGLGALAASREVRPVRRHAVGQRKAVVSAERRKEALRRAQVWRPPAAPVAQASFLRPPESKEGVLEPGDEITCRFVPRHSDGLTPKFLCVMENGEVVKVKYGRTNPETMAEVAGTRLLDALGFGADRMYTVARVHCLGCPRFPYARFRWLDILMAPLHDEVTFDWAVVERPFPAPALETADTQGWGFYELASIDPAVGGAPRAQVDAMRLMAAFLNDWDNKSPNQRLVCLGERKDAAACAHPFLVMQDLGATFGPWSMDPDGWEQHPVWADAKGCRLSMRALPFSGATFADVEITEGGRQLLAELLRPLSESQVTDLFKAARVDGYEAYASPRGRDVANWVRVFDDRVRQVTDHPACPLE